ncbi:AhpD-like protein [Dichomitus squalens]|uniref:AhpD-like protein n=1 Tax=Dichomitus squalens TaxID=114155 RepID=A0A4Q9M8Y7_9APHY|nr:AhpD-like protein [Dichomitus squalens]
MSRVPPVPLETPGLIAEDIRALLWGSHKGLEPLITTLLHAPPVAEGWSKLMGAIRMGSTLDDDLRAIMARRSAILPIAALNKASFEWVQHETLARAAGLSTEQLARIGDVKAFQPASSSPAGPGRLSAIQAMALLLADSMTVNVQVEDATIDGLRLAFLNQGDDEAAANRKVVEAVATCAACNRVCRFLVALDIDGRAKVPCPVPGEEAYVIGDS